MDNLIKKEYLGDDGVYVGHDGYQIWVGTVREDGQYHYIALDRSVLTSLISYARDLKVIG